MKTRFALIGSWAVLIGLAAVAGAEPGAKPPSPLDRPVSPAATKMELGIILQRAKALAAQGQRPVLVTDLDGTVWTEGAHDLPIAHPQPFPGAVRFFQEFAQVGQVVYLTGRKTSDRAGTLATLEKLGFPVGPSAVLFNNPADGYGNPIEWKIHAQGRIERLGQPIAFFENTKKNAIVFRDLFPYHRRPDVSVLYVSDWKNSARGRIPNGIVSIRPAYPNATRVRELVPRSAKPMLK